ncbi:MAG: agmatinase [Lysobacteraceae bacterium]
MSNSTPRTTASAATPTTIDTALTRSSPYGTLAEPTYSGVTSFLRRPYRKDVQDADVVVFGAPFDLATTNRPGARLGPRAIRSASASLAWCPPYRWGFDPLDRLQVIDFGDLYFDPGRPAEIPEQLYRQARDIVTHAVTPLALGGDHFVSFPILRALSERHGPLALIHFDAHSDTWRDDDGRIDHGTMFFHAARLGFIDPSSSIQLGMRTFNEESHGFQVCDADWLHSHGIEQALKLVHARVGQRPCYVSFDIDFLDPAFAPGTGTPVCGGFSTHQALGLIRGLAGLNVIGADVVEVAPAYDHAEITALAAASLAHELLAVIASRHT